MQWIDLVEYGVFGSMKNKQINVWHFFCLFFWSILSSAYCEWSIQVGKTAKQSSIYELLMTIFTYFTVLLWCSQSHLSCSPRQEAGAMILLLFRHDKANIIRDAPASDQKNVRTTQIYIKSKCLKLNSNAQRMYNKQTKHENLLGKGKIVGVYLSRTNRN